MKLIGRTALSFLLMAWSVTGIAQAQFVAWVVKADIPFQFQVGRKTFPAGSYSLIRTGSYTLMLRDSRAAVVATVMTTPVVAVAPHARPKLAFHVEGGQYILTCVWPANSELGDALPPTKPRMPQANPQNAKVRVMGQP